MAAMAAAGETSRGVWRMLMAKSIKKRNIAPASKRHRLTMRPQQKHQHARKISANARGAARVWLRHQHNGGAGMAMAKALRASKPLA